ncbi:MAG: phosphoadenylyl-sulfate reductase [Brumimicrobium sp.]
MKTYNDYKKLVEINESPSALLEALGLFTDPADITFSTSFGAEDQVITYLLSEYFRSCPLFTLDTGRLFQETYDTYQSTINKYKLDISVFGPEAEDLKELYNAQGPNGFYNSIENRKSCCQVRKVIPLKKALQNKKVWITGLRAEQSQNRSELSRIEYDKHFDIIKIHPILNWSWEETMKYIKEKGIPVNPLHYKGFPSIGCAPCTRAIEDGEDFRAGRWWWESSAKECGLHAK